MVSRGIWLVQDVLERKNAEEEAKTAARRAKRLKQKVCTIALLLCILNRSRRVMFAGKTKEKESLIWKRA